MIILRRKSELQRLNAAFISLLFLFLLSTSGCSAPTAPAFAPTLEAETEAPLDNSAPEDTTEDSVTDLDLQAAADYSAETLGTAVVVMRDGNIIFEDYRNGADPQTPTHLFSATKGFWGVVVAKLIEDGYLSGYDQRVSDILTEWQGTTRAGITLRQTMQLSSGLANDIDNLQGLDAAAPDLYFHAVNNVGLVRAPGSDFSYGPVNYYIVGAVIQRIIEQHNLPYSDPLDYLNKEFLAKIGIQYSDWARDESGNPHIPNGSYWVPTQWVQWGQFILQRGVWNGEPLVAQNLLEALEEPAVTNPGHGLFTWLNSQGGFGSFQFQSAPTGSAGGFMYHFGHTEITGYLGAGKNRMYLIPAKGLVVVRQTLQGDDTFEDHEFLKRLLKGQSLED